jgi:energy-coupling factor transporter ATP-binding protein EcfA2
MSPCREPDGLPRRICLVGETGSGKSTTAEVLRELLAEAGHPSQLIPLAALLHELQNLVYSQLGTAKAAGQQDQQLMLDLASNIRRIRPTALVERFERSLRALAPGTVAINADLRDHAVDAPRLRRLGFYFVRIRCDRAVRMARLRLRDDLSVVDDERVFQLDRIDFDVEFDNSRDGLGQLHDFCRGLLAGALCC